jgi:hypothetical protein
VVHVDIKPGKEWRAGRHSSLAVATLVVRPVDFSLRHHDTKALSVFALRRPQLVWPEHRGFVKGLAQGRLLRNNGRTVDGDCVSTSVTVCATHQRSAVSLSQCTCAWPTSLCQASKFLSKPEWQGQLDCKQLLTLWQCSYRDSVGGMCPPKYSNHWQMTSQAQTLLNFLKLTN